MPNLLLIFFHTFFIGFLYINLFLLQESRVRKINNYYIIKHEFFVQKKDIELTDQ
jgi:hypothetical protein